MQVSSQNVKAILLALLAFLSFTVADTLLKQTAQYYETEFSGVIIVSFFLFFLLFAIPFLGGFKPIIKPQYPFLTSIRGLLGTLCWLFFIIGMEYNELSVNYSVLLSASIWVALFSIFFLKIRFGLSQLSAILIGFLGVIIVLRPTPDNFEMTSLLPLISALCFAGCQIMTRYVGVKEKQSTIIFYNCIINVLIALLYTHFQDSWQSIEIKHLPFFIASAILYLTGNILAVKAFIIGDTAIVSPTQYSQIIWGALIGFFFFAEIPTLWTIIGASLIVLSGIILIYREHRTHKNGTRISKG